MSKYLFIQFDDSKYRLTKIVSKMNTSRYLQISQNIFSTSIDSCAIIVGSCRLVFSNTPTLFRRDKSLDHNTYMYYIRQTMSADVEGFSAKRHDDNTIDVSLNRNQFIVPFKISYLLR